MLHLLKPASSYLAPHKTTPALAPWWLDEALLKTVSSPAQGLSDQEASERLALHGPNSLQSHPSLSLIIQFLQRFKNPLVVILLIASFVSAMTGEIANFAIISVMVLMSVTLDFVQEYKANASAEKLRLTVRVHATVQRNGLTFEVPVEQVVPGDVVLLRAGDLVPADGLIVQARDFFVNQSLLTGEAFPLEKTASPLATTATELHDASNAVFMGTSVIGGSAKIYVVHTAMNTFIGEIAQSIQKSNTNNSTTPKSNQQTIHTQRKPQE